MIVSFLELDGFRNFKNGRVCFSQGINVIYGGNAQGKTNMLEALEYLSGLKSFRTRHDKDLIGFNYDDAYIKAQVSARGREFFIEARLFRGLTRRKLTINGVKQKNGAKLPGILNTVLFCPDDLYIIKESAAVRRHFLDTAICKLRPKYWSALTEYNRLHAYKSKILKDERLHPSMRDVLEDYSMRMCHVGAVIISHRAAYIKKLLQYAPGIYNDISNNTETLDIKYKTIKTIANPNASPAELLPDIIRHMREHSRAETEARSCLSGPHKDDFEVLLDGRPAKTFGSQGQIRSAALILKMAERDIIFEDTNEYPVLLLDDVLSELDITRKEYVLKKIDRGQVIITCCEESVLFDFPGAHVLKIQGGAVVED